MKKETKEKKVSDLMACYATLWVKDRGVDQVLIVVNKAIN